MSHPRFLVVIADDFGMGPATSKAILELATKGIVTGSVLLVNSPFAEAAVRDWRKLGCPMELGWHPCLTCDEPILPPEDVSTLVGPDGRFLPLGKLIKRLFFNRVSADHIRAELQAQHDRYCDLVGQPPSIVNSHQHVSLFHPVGPILAEVLQEQRRLPYVRRVKESWWMLARISGARLKRAFLSMLGKPQSQQLNYQGFPGNDALAGITSPRWVRDPYFFIRWLSAIKGEVVELACHPGYWDTTLIGRDCQENDGLLQRRVDELFLLQQPGFLEAVERCGFELVAPSEIGVESQGLRHAA